MVRGGVLRRSRAEAYARRVIDRFDVRCTGTGTIARALSGGNLQKFIVGREMELAPRVLVVSQPTWGLDVAAAAFIRRARATAERLGLDAGFLKRGVNEGFSGGEKKRNEILQMLLLEPRIAILDETDSGLDVDAMQVVAAGVNDFRDTGNAVILVTHYQRLLDYIVPDHVHVLAGGTIIRSGDRSLAQTLDRDGYGWIEDAC